MKYFKLALCLGMFYLFVLMPISSSPGQSTSGLFAYVDESEELNDPNNPLRFRQQDLLQRVRERPAVKLASVVRIQSISDLLAATGVALNVFDEQIQASSKTNIIRTVRSFTWFGQIPKNGALPLGEVYLTVTDEDVFGSIVRGNQIFVIEPLGGGLHVLAALDPGKTPECNFTGTNTSSTTTIQGIDAFRQPNNPDDSQHILSSGPRIDILVAYTNAVASACANVEALVQ